MQRNANLVDLEKMQKNEHLVAKIGDDTAENEPRKFWITDLSDHLVRPHAERLIRTTGHS